MSLGALAGMLVVVTGVLIGLGPLRDNSFLTHLATGRLILDRGSVPTVDPYSFTAPHAPWVVQSWLVSVLYAAAERVGGLDGIRLLVAAMSGALGALGWRILRPVDGLLPRIALVAVFVMVGSGTWAERPYMVGLIAFALLVLAGEGAFDPRWLVPLGWIWVNSHGSFPLGLVYLVVVSAGARLDGHNARRELRCLLWAGLGMLTGAASPLGVRLLVFPVQLLQRQDLLANVVEWQAPTFVELGERAFLVQVVIAILLLARKPSYRSGLVLAVFLAAALLGSRNVAVASVALLPGMAVAVGKVGSVSSAARSRLGLPLGLTMGGIAILLVAASLGERSLELRPYPVDVLAFLEEREVDIRHVHMAAPEVVGNLLTSMYGADGRPVFYDDRFDMYPRRVSEAHFAMSDADRDVFSRLEPFDIDLLTLPVAQPLALAVSKDPSWRILMVGERWQLACRRGSELGGELGRC